MRIIKTINAKGKPCLESVSLTKVQVDQGEEELEVLLDDAASAIDVRRFLESRNFSVLLKDDDGLLTVSARKKNDSSLKSEPSMEPSRTEPPQTELSRMELPRLKAPQPEPEKISPISPLPPAKETFSVLITRQALGQNDTSRSDASLGETLMKSFLSALSQMDDVPVAVALVNEGVKLALYDSSSCDHLKNLEQKGASILVCGVSVNHFQIIDQMGVGTLSNMPEILETLNKADKIITL